MTTTQPTKTTILLVHGAWHSSWAWQKQHPALHALGYATETVDLPSTSKQPGTTQFDDAACVHSALESLIAQGNRVVVLAHSYGGPIASAGIVGLPRAPSPSSSSAEISSAEGAVGGVVGLIVLCGYIFPGGMDQGQAIRNLDGLSFVDWDTPSPGLFMPKDARGILYEPDVSEEDTAWALQHLQPQSMAANMGIVPPQAWQEEEVWKGRLGYIRTTEDRIVPLANQTSMIDGAGGDAAWVVRTLEGSGHSPMLSRPDMVAAAVKEIVGEFEKL